MRKITNLYVVGISENYLSEKVKSKVLDSKFVFGSNELIDKLHKIFPESVTVKQLPLVPLSKAIKNIIEKVKNENVVVLASGDPLFYGVGNLLKKNILNAKIHFFPAPSFMGLAFSRCGLSWDDAHILSLHGRGIEGIDNIFNNHSKVGVFTDKINTPSEISKRLIQQYPETLLKKVKVYVVENIGNDEERLVSSSIRKVAKNERIKYPNILIFDCDKELSKQTEFSSLGLTEKMFHVSRGLITKDEVRSAAIHRLRVPSKGVVWDVGGGSGSISIEIARISPNVKIYCFEKNRDEQQNIEKNIKKFNCSNVSLIKGEAPKTFAGIEKPDRIFIGGSGGNLKKILKYSLKTINNNGYIVSNCVLKKNAQCIEKIYKKKSIKYDLSIVSVQRKIQNSDEFTTFNPITIISAKIIR